MAAAVANRALLILALSNLVAIGSLWIVGSLAVFHLEGDCCNCQLVGAHCIRQLACGDSVGLRLFAVATRRQYKIVFSLTRTCATCNHNDTLHRLAACCMCIGILGGCLICQPMLDALAFWVTVSVASRH